MSFSGFAPTSVLFEQGFYLSASIVKKNPNAPFKNHPQFSVIADILGRQQCHDIILQPNFTAAMFPPFLEAMLAAFDDERLSSRLRNAELFYINVNSLLLTKQNIEANFQNLLQHIEQSKNYCLIALNAGTHNLNNNQFILNQIELWANLPNVRLLIFNSHFIDLFNHQDFIKLELNAPNDSDILALLTRGRSELEKFHSVLIPEELLVPAYNLAKRYLSTEDTLEQTLLLLDSSAGRIHAALQNNTNQLSKPALTLNSVLQVLSNWTQIPPQQLQLHKFKFADFTQNMFQHIFGQDMSVQLLGQALQHAQARLQQHTGPFCSFLFAGPLHSGKKSMAIAFTEQLFGHVNALYFLHPLSLSANDISTIRVQRYTDKRFFKLTDIIRKTPYAIIFIDRIEQASSYLLDHLYEILTTGLLRDENDLLCDFHQSIFIFSTTLGTERLWEMSHQLHAEPDISEMNLMQLVMNEQKMPVTQHEQACTHQELIKEISPLIHEKLSQAFCQNTSIIPFMPLNKSAIEKIIRLRIKELSKILDSKYGVELSYAPEVIRFLLQDILHKRKQQAKSVEIDKALKQLYFVVEQSILSQVENKLRPTQLFLQLNETGQVLKCEWSIPTDVRHHA